jgi:2-phosphoglycerate kinase
MIILVTGASHTGKTLLAQRLLEKYASPYLSIDHLKMALIRSGNTALTPADDGKLTDYLWPIVREMVKTAIENKQNLIVEGCYIPFDWRKDFDGQYLPHIRFICLAMTDEYVERHFSDIVRYESAIEQRYVDTNCTIERVKADNKAFREGFSRSGELLSLIGANYEQTIDALLTEII